MKWTCTKDELRLVGQIAERAVSQGIVPRKLRADIAMDVVAIHNNDTPLDLPKLLKFDNFNFTHDVLGIQRHIDRKTGKLQDCFLPRCSRS